MHLDNLAEQFYTKQKGQDIFTDRKYKGNNLLLNQIKISYILFPTLYAEKIKNRFFFISRAQITPPPPFIFTG